MALRSLIQLQGLIEGIPGGSININPTDMQNNTPPSWTYQNVLGIGDNQIVVPVLAKGCVVIFDPTATTTKKIKGMGPDTGITVGKTGWFVLTFEAGGFIFIINLSANDVNKYTTVIFF